MPVIVLASEQEVSVKQQSDGTVQIERIWQTEMSSDGELVTLSQEEALFVAEAIIAKRSATKHTEQQRRTEVRGLVRRKQ